MSAIYSWLLNENTVLASSFDCLLFLSVINVWYLSVPSTVLVGTVPARGVQRIYYLFLFFYLVIFFISSTSL